MIIALCNGKGGSGKTTLAILLASALAEAGHDVAIRDTDPQKTATRWLEETSARVSIAKSGKSYGAVVIDTPPRLESTVVSDAISEAQAIIVVTSPSPADLFTSRDTVHLINKLGRQSEARLLFNQVQPGTILARDLSDIADRVGLPALKNEVHRRQAYQHAVMLGWKCLPHDAREELFRVALEITSIAK